ncbi:cytochrome c oxidase subunit IV [Clavulina sp. PMI_390]|nr:cytochrome c oxidase subunit IV [Clavulina sp. PMI_390]
MNALRVAARQPARALRQQRLASTISVVSHTTSESALPLSNVEAQWEKLAKEEQVQIYRQLEAVQKKDWKAMTLDEKKAAYYVAFGPHGPRTPVNPPGTAAKVAATVAGLFLVAGAIVGVTRSFAPPPPKTLTKEWQEASNEYARENKINPITGISSEGYKGTGFVSN